MFVTACALIVLGTVYSHPGESLIGWTILASGIPVYLYWRGSAKRTEEKRDKAKA